MTPQEEIYLNECEIMLHLLSNNVFGAKGAKAVCVNALTEHIRKVRGMVTEPYVGRSDKMEFLVGLTFADIMQLQNGGSIQVNPKTVGLEDLPITIFLGGTEEHMAKGLEKHPGAVAKFTDTHGEQKN